MPANDAIHAAVRNALIKDGWTITDDPYVLRFGDDKLFADLGAEKVLAADRGTDRIAVECKSFLAPSVLYSLEQAVGQFLLYRVVMARVDPGRRLVLAVGSGAYDAIQRRASAVLLLEDQRIPFLIVALDSEEVVRWTS
ncbi:MAG: XisH family protein [Fimbriiglobus sp.]